ncbi:MAG: hypothetical protein KBH14_04565 [Vicinamibacteria bacterium]|nr:hypothetical protein [Vicinamibacteria bacterium]
MQMLRIGALRKQLRGFGSDLQADGDAREHAGLLELAFVEEDTSGRVNLRPAGHTRGYPKAPRWS